MRQERTVQATLFEVFAQHEIGCELKAMSRWLDGQRALISLVADDLRRQEVRETGRRGLPAESVLRCALLKQQRQLCYEELAFHLEDSASFRAFARLPLAWSPKKSVLHHTIAAIRAETWEAVNQALLASAQKDRLESGAMMRLDSTVTAALMHEPSDSALLWDAVRVMTRLLDRGEALAATPAIRIAGVAASASPRSNSRVITRTASHNRALSLGSCISAAVTVLSSRIIAPLSSRSFWALASSAWLTASQVSARIAAIVWCSTDFFGDHANGRRAKARNDAESSR